MKRLISILAITAALTVGGCAENETGSATGFGRIAVAATADNAIDTRAATVPAVEDFRFDLTGDNGYEGSWQSVGEFAQCDTLFKNGRYTAFIAYGDPEAEGGDAYYEGRTTFDLAARRTNTVRIQAQIANSQTLVRATEQFLAYFHDASFTVTTGSGNKFDFTPGAATPDQAVFVKAGTSLTVTGTARRQSPTGTDEGPRVEFSADPLAATKPRTRHIFTFDAADAGSATVRIELGEGESIVEPVTIELNDGAIKDE